MPNKLAAHHKNAHTTKQSRLVDAYIANGGNGTQVEIIAGFVEKSAYVTAFRLLSVPKIRDALIDHTDQIFAQAVRSIACTHPASRLITPK